MQSAFHVAIIMDGNGRWATERGMPRPAGHRAGAEAVRRVVEAAPDAGIDMLTLYAFSSDNWNRPRTEVETLMTLFQRFLSSEIARCVDAGVRLSIIGRRDRLTPTLLRLIESAEDATRPGSRVWLRLAIDYSSRNAIARRDFIEDVDLLIRTGREKRLSDFLLFEAAYAELHFTDKLWPDFNRDDLLHAVHEFHSRQRRFGAISEESATCTT